MANRRAEFSFQLCTLCTMVVHALVASRHDEATIIWATNRGSPLHKRVSEQTPTLWPERVEPPISANRRLEKNAELQIVSG
jgi:hypothetical protein